jgi:putative membrane protein insertion efficiency factor
MKRAAVTVLAVPIHLYRMLISPLFAPVCRFEPTCSEYALDALHVHGPIKGIALTARRLSRCHPFTWLGGSSGFDPVPPK